MKVTNRNGRLESEEATPGRFPVRERLKLHGRFNVDSRKVHSPPVPRDVPRGDGYEGKAPSGSRRVRRAQAEEPLGTSTGLAGWKRGNPGHAVTAWREVRRSRSHEWRENGLKPGRGKVGLEQTTGWYSWQGLPEGPKDHGKKGGREASSRKGGSDATSLSRQRRASANEPLFAAPASSNGL